MKKGWMVEYRLSGLSLEKLLNAARSQGVRFFYVKREKDRALILRSSPRAYALCRDLAQEKGYEITDPKPIRIMKWARRLRNRAGLLLGGVMAAALIVYALGFVWQVRIENAGSYEGAVREYLEEIGVRPMIRRSGVSLDELRSKIEWYLPRVKWVRAEWAGVTLKIRLEEGAFPEEQENAAAPRDIVADQDGVILRLTTFAGTPCVKEGDIVRAGQILIRGEEKGKNGETVAVRAQGEAMARVWATARVRLPGIQYQSFPTGRKAVTRSFQTPLGAYPDYEAPDFLQYDRQIDVYPLGGAWIPVCLVRETDAEVYLEKEARPLEETKREGAKAAFFLLNQALITDEIVDKWINFSMIEGDTILVEATAETIRQIGRSQRP